MAKKTSSAKPKKEIDKQNSLSIEERFDIPFYMPHPGIVKLIRAFEKKFGKDVTHRIVREVSQELHLQMMNEALAGRKINSFADFMESMQRWPAIFGEATDGRVTESSSAKYALEAYQCWWAKTWQRMGAADIGYLWDCCGDTDIEKLHPRLRFKRKATLMQGAKLCDCCYYWE